MQFQTILKSNAAAVIRAGLVLAAIESATVAGQLTIVVKDQTGLVVPSAQIAIKGPQQDYQKVTDAAGSFSLSEAPLGVYRITATSPGFSPAQARIELTASHPAQRSEMVLRVMQHLDEVQVSAVPEGSEPDPTRGLGSQVLGAREIAILPDDPDQLRARLQMLAAASGGISGQAPILTDGFLTEGTLPSKSSIREIRINPDLYSAQYANQPIFGGGLIEIDTKPALESVHGGLGWTWNGGALDARDSLAPSRTAISNNVWSGDVSLPILKHRLSSSTSFERKNLNQFAVVDAMTLSPDLAEQRVVDNIATPERLTTLAERLDLQATPTELLAFRYSHQSLSYDNFGAGALTLPDAAASQRTQTDEVRITATSTLSGTALNEARFGQTFSKNWLTPNSNAPAVAVAGGFLSGGSGSQYTTDFRRNTEFSDTLSLALHQNTIRAGVQVLRFGIDEQQRGGFNGQLLFAGGNFGAAGSYLSGLDQYRAWLSGAPGISPTVEQITQGFAPLALTQWQVSGFLQDEWRPSSRLSLSMGVRYETQTTPWNDGGLAPRFGVAYSLDRKSLWVARFRFGIFYHRIDPAVALEDLRLAGAQNDILRYGVAATGSALTIASGRLPFAQVQPGRSIQPQFTLERRIHGGTVIQAGYTRMVADHLLRSESAFAAAMPNGGPDPSGEPLQNRLQYVSNGGERGSVAMLTVNSSAIRHVNFFGGYLYMNLVTNADSPNLFPQSEADPSAGGDWAMPAWQSRHRFFTGGFAQLPGKLEWTFLTAVIAGNAFDITTGRDNNQDGIFNDRPSLVYPGFPGAILTPYGALDPFAINGTLPRNFGRLPISLTVDTGLSRRFTLRETEHGSRSITVSARATNLTNHMNVGTVNGVLGSPLFLQTVEADPSRRIELGIRFSF